MKKEKNLRKKFLFSAWSGIFIFILAIVGTIISILLSKNIKLLSYYSLLQGIIFNLAMIFFTYGFYLIGKKYKSKLLVTISILIIIFIVLSYIFNLTVFSPMMQKNQIGILNLNTTIFEEASNKGYNIDSLTEEQSLEIMQLVAPEMLKIFMPAFILIGIYFTFLIILSILFGAGLIKVRKEVKLAKAAGILEIVGALTLILLVGFILIFIAYILEIIILFKESKK